MVKKSVKPIEGLTHRLIRDAADGHGFLAVCCLLGLACSISASPVIPIIVTDAMISPRRWHTISVSIALGCSFGAVVLVMLFHYLGWSLVDQFFPEFWHHPAWQNMQDWIVSYKEIGLAAISASPLPEMPALIVLGLAKPDIIVVFIAVLIGKLFKYGLISWLASHFPDKLSHGINGLLRWLRRE
jgi:membrane protein YqaA with SNARE-associated domain